MTVPLPFMMFLVVALVMCLTLFALVALIELTRPSSEPVLAPWMEQEGPKRRTPHPRRTEHRPVSVVRRGEEVYRVRRPAR